MALSEDQKAMLRVLAQRGEQGYEDLAALMGIGVDEVHARATSAAAQLEAEGIPAPAIPPAPGAGARPQPPAPEPKPPAQQPAEPAPRATPEPSAESGSAPRATPEPPPGPPARPGTSGTQRPRPSLPSGGGARAAIAAGALVAVALAIVLLVSGGDSGETTGGGSGGGTAAEEPVDTAGSAAREVTQAVLEPVDGSDAEGRAVFGRVKNSLALQVEASGLEPTGKGESYTIWLYESPAKMLPLGSTVVDRRGRIGAQIEVPTEVLGYLASEAFDQINISRTTNAILKASLAKATREKETPIYTGTDVLRGPITGEIIGAALD
jgi:hypothetical protein